MKYEYLCGHESDFFTMPANVIAVVRLDYCVQGLTEFSQIIECGKPVLAMRRIIAEPNHWTVEDQKAGVLPEVLGKVTTYDGKTYLFVGESCHDNQWALKDDATGKVYHTPTGDILPIETPAEKAQRERDEWIESAYNFSTKGTYPEIDFGYLYDALKSGELPMPNKE